MRKVILSVLLVLAIIGFIGAAFKPMAVTPHDPVNISGGLTFEIPYEKRRRFFVTGLEPHTNQMYYIKDFMTNSVSGPDIDSTQILYNDADLIADSGIKYQHQGKLTYVPRKITLKIQGNIDPKKTRGFMDKTKL